MRKISITNIFLAFFILGVLLVASMMYLNPDHPYYSPYYSIRNKLDLTYTRMLRITHILDTLSQNEIPENLEKVKMIYRQKYDSVTYNAIDPFTGKEYLYKKYSCNGKECWFLLSPCIDSAVNSSFNPDNILQYDPTNGSKSSGDIVFTNMVSARNFLTSSDMPQRKGIWKPSADGYRKEQ